VKGRVLHTVCAWCDRVRGDGGEWHDTDPADEAGPVTHGICPECLERATARATMAAAVTTG
jgi:hypothetical protein